jgi:hypothetical protein
LRAISAVAAPCSSIAEPIVVAIALTSSIVAVMPWIASTASLVALWIWLTYAGADLLGGFRGLAVNVRGRSIGATPAQPGTESCPAAR